MKEKNGCDPYNFAGTWEQPNMPHSYWYCVSTPGGALNIKSVGILNLQLLVSTVIGIYISQQIHSGSGKCWALNACGAHIQYTVTSVHSILVHALHINFFINPLKLMQHGRCLKASKHKIIFDCRWLYIACCFTAQHDLHTNGLT